MSADEFGAIQRLLSKGKRTVGRSKVWMRIHEETCAGVVIGDQLQFNASDLHRLREYGKQLTGLDPMRDSTAGSRMQMAEKRAPEKLASDSVFGNLLVLATAGDAQVVVNGGRIRTPPGSVLSVLPEAIDYEQLTQSRIVIIENGSLMPHWHDIRLPPEWRNSVLMYRGHRENVQHTRKIIADQPGGNLALYFDFDPEGLEMALSIGKGDILIPENWRELGEDSTNLTGINQRTVFRRQNEAMKRLQTIAKNSAWEAVTTVLAQGELAVMQEHMTTHHWPLVTHPGV